MSVSIPQRRRAARAMFGVPGGGVPVAAGPGRGGREDLALGHAWAIAEREVARQTARRGRRHAYERVDPLRTALVVIDMVPVCVEANPYCRAVVAPINRLAEALRSAGGVVAWVLPSGEAAHPAWPDGACGAQAAAAPWASGEATLMARLHADLRAEAGDVFVEKTSASAFFPGRCALPELLAARGVETVVVAGTVTDVCCEGSARDAATLGFQVILAADATAAGSDAAHNAALRVVYRSFGDVRPVGEILGLVGARRPGGI